MTQVSGRSEAVVPDWKDKAAYTHSKKSEPSIGPGYSGTVSFSEATSPEGIIQVQPRQPAAMALPREHAPVATALPELPSRDMLNQAQWDVLCALFDAVNPSYTSASAVRDKDAQIVLPDD